ncbi:MAG: T9SS type A sorting domain-containing protein [Sphingomonadales bacterium]
MRILLFFYLLFFLKINAHAQFAPAAGKPGSTALKHDSTCFISWATGCDVIRGYRDISQPDSGFADAGAAQSALGQALQNGIVSLGDGGTATLTFSNPIINGPGWDFAVFENSFLDTFLELAFVEISSDGKRFVRFPAISFTDTSKQTQAFGYTFPEKINNLAGKYRVGFGTPFDLEELKDSAGIDISSITHVRIIDVVGSMLPDFATRDTKGNKINDPWPTRFSSGGFDLDAVGVIHAKVSIQKNNARHSSSIKIGPNPVYNGEINVYSNQQGIATLYSISGNKIVSWNIQNEQNTLKIPQHTGMYCIVIYTPDGTFRQLIEIIR